MIDALRVIATGGTIDGLSPAKRSSRSFVQQMIKQSRATIPISVEIAFLKDSRDITDKDRELLAEKCILCKEKRIVITHGTFTMSKTAAYLSKRVKGKTIVLTGSSIPFKAKQSDALFNLGSAILAVQLLPKGVWVVSNGLAFKAGAVKKNLRTGVFEKLKK